MGIEHEQFLVLGRQQPQQLAKREVLQHIGKIAGVKAVAVVHAMAIAWPRSNFGETDLATHELHSSPETCHWGYFDSQLKPSLRIKSGDIATIHCVSGAAEILPGEPFNVLPEHREILGTLKPH